MFDSASEILNTAIPGLSFGSISVVIPKTWNSCGTFKPIRDSTSLMTWNSSDIKIGNAHPVFGYEPWTQQPRGCGLEGDFISLPRTWILTPTFSDKQKGKIFFLTFKYNFFNFMINYEKF